MLCAIKLLQPPQVMTPADMPLLSLQLMHEVPSTPFSAPSSVESAGRALRKGSEAASRWLQSSTHAAGTLLSLDGANVWNGGEGHGEAVILRAPAARRHRRQLAQVATTPTPTPTEVRLHRFQCPVKAT